MTAAPDGRIITFYSYKGGTGRTMALANVAWILAANGKRVLAADWDLESPGLHRYFHPFLEEGALAATTGVIDIVNDYRWAATEDRARPTDWHRDFASVRPHAIPLAVDGIGLRFPEGGALDFLSAGRQDRAYSATVSSLDWDDFYERLGGGQFLDALRDDMKAAYDYVLIDSRTGLSDIADICTVQLPDVLVDCFTLSDQSIDGAATVARSITERFSDRAIRVLPVPMRVDDGEKEKADAGRALARLRFEGLPTAFDGGRLSPQENTTYWYGVEVPYRPYYAYEEVLATFADASGTTGSLLAAYERLTAAITDGEVDSLPPIPERTRLRGQDRFVRRRPVPRHEVAVAYAPENLMWAEWVEATLTRAGCGVSRHDLSTGPVERPEETTRTAVLLSRAAVDSRYTSDFLGALSAPTASSDGPVLVLRVDEARMPSYRSDHLQLDLHRMGEADCAAALLRVFALPEGTDDAPPLVRFPGRVPKVWDVPPRNPAFTGRNVQLTRVRGEFAGGMAGVQALVGLGGVGKTALAIEYAHRFLADYDLVWWISAERPDGVTAALAELGLRLGLVGGDITRTAQETVRLLSAEDRPLPRWLLVFDHADAPDEIREHLPPSGGHVLVTSRNQEWTSQVDSVPVDVFPREESVRLIGRRAPGLAPEDADAVASAVGDLPLAVEQAAAWLAETATPVDLYLEQLTAQTTDVSFPGSVTATWNLSIARLREHSPGAARLLELCAFFSAEPISTSLLFTAEMLEALRPYDPTLQEKLLIGRLLREIGRFSLAVIDPAGGTVQVHRLLQDAIRSQLDEDQRLEARRVVHRLLAAARPDADEPVDDPETWPRFETIWPHLKAAGVRDAEIPQARRLLIDRVRYLEKRGLLSQARRLAEDLLVHWEQLLGEEDVQYLYLRGRLADVLRAEGKFTEARDLDEDLLERQRAVLGPAHPHAYVTMSGLARDQAALGEYDTALDLAHAAHEGFEDIFWAYHPRTMAAAADLALALRAVGRYEEARALDEQTLNRRTETLGSDHPATLASAESLGTDLRAAGRYAESAELLGRTYETYRRVLGEDFPGSLRCARSLAVSLRWMNRIHEARLLTEETLARYATLHESPTPDSLACELSLAIDLFTVGENQAALELGTRTLATYLRTMGTQHPYTLTALHNLGLLHRGCGDIEQAELVFAEVGRQLADTLGDRHPYTLFCTANHANVLAELGRFEEADALEAVATAGLSEVLGPRHPEYLATLANRALTLTALGRDEEAARLRDEVEERLLALSSHETRLVRAVRELRRFSRSLVPMAN